MSALVVPQLRETGCCAQLQQLASLLLSDAFRDPIVLLSSMFIAARTKNSMITPQSIKLGLIPALFSGFDSSKGLPQNGHGIVPVTPQSVGECSEKAGECPFCTRFAIYCQALTYER